MIFVRQPTPGRSFRETVFPEKGPHQVTHASACRIPSTAIIASKHLTRTSRPPVRKGSPNGRANGPTIEGDGLPKRKSQKRHTTRNVMKKLIVLILCLTACRTADAQSVRFFATADDYLNGRFDTLPRSSLKVRRPFIAIRKTRIPKGELRHRLRAMGPNLLVVGDSVYSNLTTVGVGKPSKRFRRVERFGDRIFFLTWTESQYMNAMLAGYMFGIIGNTLYSGLARPYCCYWNLQTGEFRLLDSGCLYDLLEKYPDLYENYLAEPEPNRRKTLEDYFIKYLEREKPELLRSASSEKASVTEDTTDQRSD